MRRAQRDTCAHTEDGLPCVGEAAGKTTLNRQHDGSGGSAEQQRGKRIVSAAEAGPRAGVQQGPSAARRRARIDQQRPAEATAGTALASWARWQKTEKF